MKIKSHHLPFIALFTAFLLTANAAETAQKPLCDFKDIATAKTLGWRVLNDDVMGGVSQSRTTYRNNVLEFTGKLSLANNGGFASIRTKEMAFPITDETGITLKVKGDGRRYELRLQTKETVSRMGREFPVSFSSGFETEKDVWKEVRISFADLKQSWRGMMLKDHPFKPSDIQMLGIMLADKKPGPFALSIAWIRADKTE